MISSTGVGYHTNKMYTSQYIKLLVGHLYKALITFIQLSVSGLGQHVVTDENRF